MELTEPLAPGQLLRFRIAAEHFLTPVASIDEVVDPIEYTPLPATAEWFKGLATIKGRLIPVSDLGGFSAGTSSDRADNAKWLVVNDGVERFAVIVDEVLGLTDPEDCENQKAENTALANADKESFTAVISGSVMIDGQVACLIDLCELLRLPSFVAIGTSSGSNVQRESELLE